MKRYIRIFIILLAAVFMVSVFSGCSKEIADRGTLTVRVWNPDGEINVRVYPYIADYDKLLPVAASTLNNKSTEVSFDLNIGNYVVICNGTSINRKDCIQIQSGETYKLDL